MSAPTAKELEMERELARRDNSFFRDGFICGVIAAIVCMVGGIVIGVRWLS